MEELLDYDKDLFLYLNSLGSEQWDILWLTITNKWMSIPIYILLLVLLFKKFGWKPTLLTLVLVAAMITCTDQLANLFKHGFERARPCQAHALGDYARVIAVRCGRFGFFSAHSASSMALALFIGFLLKSRYKFILPFMLFWALLVGYSRIYVGVHYPLDVLVGFSIGGLIGFGFYKLQVFLHKTYIK